MIERRIIAVLDTETNWHDEVMSVGITLAEEGTYEPLEYRYYILSPEYRVGGMFSAALSCEKSEPRICSRKQFISSLNAWLESNGVTDLFAYNARFDYGHLPELKEYHWYDIMRIAAYRQYNVEIPAEAECCKTGRLKRNYGVESMLKLLSQNWTYREKHNALEDALDELCIMRLLGHGLETYEISKIN